MHYLAVYSSSKKLVLGVTPSPRTDSIISKKPLCCSFKIPKRNLTSKSTSVSAVFNPQGSFPRTVSKSNVVERVVFARISSSSNQQTSSVGTPQIAVPLPSSQLGSPLFWVGVGVAFSAAFSWAASYMKASQNGAAFKPPMATDNPFQGASSSTGTTNPNPVMSVEALEKMMEDPKYLLEEMKNPATLIRMLQNPHYRQKVQDKLNSMEGSPEMDSRMLESLKKFDFSSPEVKEQFDQLGFTPEEVLSKMNANPDVVMGFKNPRVQAAIMDCCQDPMSIMKYQDDKEVMDLFNKIAELFPGITYAP